MPTNTLLWKFLYLLKLFWYLLLSLSFLWAPTCLNPALIWILSLHLQFISLRSILVLSSYLRPGLPSCFLFNYWIVRKINKKFAAKLHNTLNLVTVDHIFHIIYETIVFRAIFYSNSMFMVKSLYHTSWIDECINRLQWGKPISRSPSHVPCLVYSRKCP